MLCTACTENTPSSLIGQVVGSLWHCSSLSPEATEEPAEISTLASGDSLRDLNFKHILGGHQDRMHEPEDASFHTGFP